MKQQLDLFTASVYDIEVGKNRTLLSNITCTYLDVTGGTRYFEFSGYTGGTLVIKNSAGTILMTFTTGNGLTLGNNGVFTLSKTAVEMDTIRAGQYNYDMYISSATQPKRAFLWGKIIFVQNIAN
jgi:hypothetical protein